MTQTIDEQIAEAAEDRGQAMTAMSPETLAALRDSIAHWDRHATGTAAEGESVGEDDCALCQLFIAKNCRGCPISASTGRTLCVKSPYNEASGKFIGYGPDSPEFRDAAAKMRDFLQGLMPEGETV